MASDQKLHLPPWFIYLLLIISISSDLFAQSYPIPNFNSLGSSSAPRILLQQKTGSNPRYINNGIKGNWLLTHHRPTNIFAAEIDPPHDVVFPPSSPPPHITPVVPATPVFSPPRRCRCRCGRSASGSDDDESYGPGGWRLSDDPQMPYPPMCPHGCTLDAPSFCCPGTSIG